MNDHDGRINILLVDDSEDKLVTLEAILGELNLNLVRANSGREALRKLLNQEFAAILLDVNMPAMDGFETAALIRQRRSSETTPIIFITAFSDEVFVARGYALGAVDYILTPVIAEVLRAKVSVFVELYRKSQEVRQSAAKLQLRANQLAALAADVTDAEQRERRRLAQAIHDNLQQLILAARMRLSILVKRINGSDGEMLSQVDDLLAKAIEASRTLTTDLSPPILYDVGLVAAIEWLARQMKERHGLNIAVHGEEGIEIDSESLRIFAFQAVREMLFNIVKHAGTKDARVAVARCSDGYVRITVQDDGAGFEPSALEAVSSRAEHFGLFSISERAGLLQGRFDISSAPGSGTRVTLELPNQPQFQLSPEALIAARHAGPSEHESAAHHLTDSEAKHEAAGNGDNKIRVVVADDHKIIRKGLAALLEREPDIDVIAEAVDGPSAIETARRLRPDIMIMDVSMPGMSGIEATRCIKKDFPNIRIIGLSMHEQVDMATAMRRAGASAYLTKGGPAEVLLAEIRAAAATTE